MKKIINSVIEYYNNGLDEFEIYGYRYEFGNIVFQISKNKSNIYEVYFYEWLINPKYKVFEVFKIDLYQDVYDLINQENYKEYKQPEEILTYLSSQTGGEV